MRRPDLARVAMGVLALTTWFAAGAAHASGPRRFRLHVHLDNDPTFATDREAVSAAAQTLVRELCDALRQVDRFGDVVAPDTAPASWELVVSGADPYYLAGAWLDVPRSLDGSRRTPELSDRWATYLGFSADTRSKNESDFWQAASKSTSHDRTFYVLLTGAGAATTDSRVPATLAGHVFALDPRGGNRKAKLLGGSERVTLTDTEALPLQLVNEVVGDFLIDDWAAGGHWSRCGEVPVGAARGDLLLVGDFTSPKEGLRLFGPDGSDDVVPAPVLEEWQKLSSNGLGALTKIRDVSGITSVGARMGSRAFCKWRVGTPPSLEVHQSAQRLFPGESFDVKVVEAPGQTRAAWGPLDVVLAPAGTVPLADAPRCRASAAVAAPCHLVAPDAGKYDVLLRVPPEVDAFAEWRAPPGQSVSVSARGSVALVLTVKNVPCEGAASAIGDGGQTWVWDVPPSEWCVDYVVSASGQGPDGEALDPARLQEFVALATIRVRKGNEPLKDEVLKSARGTLTLDLSLGMDRDDVTIELVPRGGRQGIRRVEVRDLAVVFPDSPTQTYAFHDRHLWAWGTVGAIALALLVFAMYAGFRGRDVRLLVGLPGWAVEFERPGRATARGARTQGFPAALGIASVLVRRRWFGLELVVEPRRDFRSEGADHYPRLARTRFRRHVASMWGPFQVTATTSPARSHAPPFSGPRRKGGA